MLIYLLRRAFRKRYRREDEGMDKPRIVGDGLHDDTEGIQALLDGRPVDASENIVSWGTPIRVTGGVFRVSGLIFVPEHGPETVWDSCRWLCEDITPEAWQDSKGYPYGVGPFRFGTPTETPSQERR